MKPTLAVVAVLFLLVSACVFMAAYMLGNAFADILTFWRG